MKYSSLRKIFAFLLIFCLLVSLVPAVSARAEGGADPDGQSEAYDIEIYEEWIDEEGRHVETGFFYNPGISDIESEEEVFAELRQEVEDRKAAGEEESGDLPSPETCESVSTTDQAGLVLRAGLKRHDEYIEMVTTSDMSSNESRAAIWKKAYEHTGDPLEGDYLERQFKGGTYRNTNNGDGTYTLRLTPRYYITATQETYLTQKVNSVLNELGVRSSSVDARTKIRKIYDYVCANVTYDNEHKGDDTYKLQYTAYAALMNGTAVCQGYAVLVYRLLLTVGVDCRYIRGTSKGESHGWNIAKIGSLYYYLDTTWDAGKTRYTWYLRGRGFFPDHTRSADYDTVEFHTRYPMFDGLGIVDYPELTNTTKGVLVSWEPASNALFYEVRRAVARGDTPSNEWQYISLGTTTGTTFLDDTVDMKHQYSYCICPAVPVFTDEPGRPRVSKWEPFEDVHSYSSFGDAVVWAVRRGIVRGTSETTFSPYNDCTRYQFAVMLYKLAGQPEVEDVTLPFKDVTRKNSYYKAVCWAYSEGIISGTSRTTFSPNGTIKRYQAVQMLYKYAGRPGVPSGTNPFTDVKKTDSYYKAVMWAYRTGITSGTTSTTFSPDNSCQRYQIVVFLYKYMVKG